MRRERTMINSLLIALVLLAFGAPWTWLLYRRASERSFERVLDCICLGYAISFAALFVAAQLRLWIFAPIWLCGVLACAVDTLRRSRPRLPPVALGTEAQVLLGSAGVYLVLRCLPFTVRRLPLGWDAYFHMTISESILARGRAVHDWLPYEDIPLNYPIGAHLLLALTQWLTGVRPHQFFELLVVMFTLLSGLQLFSLVTRATQDRTVGCYAALAYLFLGNLGSLHYAIWSGLPNLIGMYLFLGLLSSLTVDPPSRWHGAATFVTLFLAACFVHHHVMVTAGLCLGWTAVVSLLTGDRARTQRIVLGLAASGLVGAPYFMMYLLSSVNLGQTDIEGYLENLADAWGLAQDLGLGFSIAAAAGAYLYFKQNERVSPIVIQPLVAMLLLYVLVEFMVRTGSLVLFQHEIAPFTPSRFITDAVTLLSAFAGIFFRTMQGSDKPIRMPIVALILCGFFVFNRATYRDTFGVEVARDRRASYTWIQKNTQPDAVLLDGDLHATYFTRRMSSSFPLPTSEYSSRAKNRQLLEAVASGRERPERIGRQVLSVVEPGQKLPPGKLLWSHPSELRIVEVFAP